MNRLLPVWMMFSGILFSPIAQSYTPEIKTQEQEDEILVPKESEILDVEEFITSVLETEKNAKRPQVLDSLLPGDINEPPSQFWQTVDGIVQRSGMGTLVVGAVALFVTWWMYKNPVRLRQLWLGGPRAVEAQYGLRTANAQLFFDDLQTWVDRANTEPERIVACRELEQIAKQLNDGTPLHSAMVDIVNTKITSLKQSMPGTGEKVGAFNTSLMGRRRISSVH